MSHGITPAGIDLKRVVVFPESRRLACSYVAVPRVMDVLNDNF
jgi:hypothetical protein